MRYQLLFLPLLIACPIHAQDKGFLSGNVSYDAQKLDEDGDDDDETLSTWVFGPSFGYNVSARDVIGLQVSLQGQTYKYQVFTGFGDAEITETQLLLEAALFYRHMKSVGDNCSIYVQLKAGGGAGKSTVELEGDEMPGLDVTTLGVAIGPGIYYAFAEHWAVTADWGLLQYASRTEKLEDDDEKSTISGLTIALTPAALSFGLNWLF